MEDSKKWDAKQIGAGGGLVAVLALFFTQGMEQINSKTSAENQAVIERTMANTQRINRLENRIDRGFDEIKLQVTKLGDIIRINTSDRYTKDDHDSYARVVEDRFERIEDKILIIKSELIQKRNKDQ